MGINAIIKVTGLGAFVAIVIWLIVQAGSIATNPLIENGLLIVAAVLGAVAIIDGLRNGLAD